MSTGFELLLLEDDEVDAMAVQRALADVAVTVQVFTNGADLLAAERLHAEANVEQLLIMLDLNLPGMGGLEVLEILRERFPGGHPPVVVLTTSADHRDHSTAVHHGIGGYFVKPVDAGELRDLLQTIVAYWQRSLPLG